MRKPAYKILPDSTCIPLISKLYLGYVIEHIFESGRGGGGTDDAMPESPVTPSIYLSLVVEEGAQTMQCLSHL